MFQLINNTVVLCFIVENVNQYQRRPELVKAFALPAQTNTKVPVQGASNEGGAPAPEKPTAHKSGAESGAASGAAPAAVAPTAPNSGTAVTGKAGPKAPRWLFDTWLQTEW